LFAFLVSVTGFSTLTAEIGLVSYTLLILIRNIIEGIEGVPESVRDAASGMGLGPIRRLLTVELPLASPAIIAGVRIATVTTVGLVTVTGLIGMGGYGSFIDSGLNRLFSTEIVVGAGLSVIMALVLDGLLVAVEWFITPWRRRSRTGRRPEPAAWQPEIPAVAP
jgi:osmoprotectant transport system permease protein